jgi:nucleoside-diphosphate-sugar epimerase
VKVLVIGASRGTGALCVNEALSRGHQVTAFSRSGSPRTHERLTDVRGSFHDAGQVAAAVAGHEAVIITASATSVGIWSEQPDYFARGTQLTIDAMKQHGVKRLVVLSALGVGDSKALMNFMMRMMVINGILRKPFADHEVQETVVMASGLDWVLARPGRLTDGPAKRVYTQSSKLEPLPSSSISRADVADFLVGACERTDVVGKAVQLGG